MLARIPIVGQLLALVALGILATAAAMMAITFSGPPPREPPVRLGDVAQALAGQPEMQARFAVERVPDPAMLAGGLAERPDIARAIAASIGAPDRAVRVWVEEWRDVPPSGPPPPRGAGAPVEQPVGATRDLSFAGFLIARQGSAGDWLTLRRGPDRNLIRWQKITALTICGVALLTFLLAWLAARRITGPIRQLAEAARSSRAGARLVLDVPAGPPEVAEAARALHDFQQRSMDLAEQRLAMLRAMAHDIGTPLARLAFRHEQLPDAAREAALRDILTIRQLLADSLLLARGPAGKSEPVDLAALCRSIVQREQDTGRNVVLHGDSVAIIEGHPLSLERMVQNLVDNAIRYGDAAEITLSAKAGKVVLAVADNGPGFPELAPEDLLKPFVRGESSRSDQTGGSGLGLAIVAQVVAQHGGTIELGAGPEGSGLVTVTFG